jgi:hypothetical protein
VPERENLDGLLTVCSVVEVEVDPGQVDPPHSREGYVKRPRAHSRLCRDHLEAASQLSPEEIARRRTVLLPPSGCLTNLPLGEGGDS